MHPSKVKKELLEEFDSIIPEIKDSLSALVDSLEAATSKFFKNYIFTPHRGKLRTYRVR